MSKIELSSRQVRLLAAVVLVATFIIGAAAGAGVWHWVMSSRPGPLPPMFGRIPIHALDLSEDQMKRFDAILEKHRPELDQILADSFPKVRAVNEKIEAELAGILDASQKKKLGEIKARRPAHPMHRGRGHGRDPGAGPMAGPEEPWGPPPPPPGPPPGAPPPDAPLSPAAPHPSSPSPHPSPE